MAAKKPAAKKTTKKKELKPSLEALQAAAEEFNEIMEFEGGEEISTDLDYEELKAEIVETATQLEEEDVISSELADTLDELGVEYKAEVVAEEGDEEPEDPPEEEDEVEESEDEEADEEEENEDEEEPAGEPVDVSKELKAVKAAKKLDAVKTIAKEKGIRIPPPFLKDLKKMKTYVTGKLEDMAEGKVAPKKPEKKQKKAAKQAPSYTRSHALIDALKQTGTGTREEIVNVADTLFVENGGNSNQNVSSYMFGYVMPSLIILGHVTKDGKDFSWNK